MQVHDAGKNLAFAYQVGKDGALEKGGVLFELSADDVFPISEPVSAWSSRYSDHSTSVAEKFSNESGVGGSYGAFSASLTMGVTSSSTFEYKTSRLDNECEAVQLILRPGAEFNTAPHTKLHPKVEKYLLEKTPEEIERNLGVFFSKGCKLGALYRESYIMETTSKDSEHSLRAEIEASYGPPGFACSVKSKTEKSTRKKNSNCNVKITTVCQGGDAKQWLKLGGGAAHSAVAEVVTKWADSVAPENMIAFKHNLCPIWDLVALLDEEKGDAVKKYLTEKWTGSIPKPPRKFRTGRDEMREVYVYRRTDPAWAIYVVDATNKSEIQDMGSCWKPSPHMKFWGFKTKQPGTKRLCAGVATNDFYRCMFNHTKFDQDYWNNTSNTMSVEGFSHLLDFWAFEDQQPGTIRVAVGFTTNKRWRMFVNHPKAVQDEWNKGKSMTFEGWQHVFDFWVYPEEAF